jgi:glycosyltransferase involved in cell wall biosynthesis
LLNVLHATAWYPPYHLGGTEVYVEGLVSELGKQGVVSKVIVPRHPDAPEDYVHAGVPVSTYPVGGHPSPAELRGLEPHEGFEAFTAILARNKGAIYHQHAWTRGCGAWHLRAAREMGMRTVLTVHVPANLCLRGTMMRYGKAACDGQVEAAACASCWAEGRGAPPFAAGLLGRMPGSLSALAGTLPGRLGTALSARALAEDKRRELCDMAANADRIVAVCRWLYDALALNGIPREKLVLSRQGLPPSLIAALREAREARARARRRQPGRPLRLLYLGRWHPVKGADVLVRAVRELGPDVPVELTIHAIAGGEEERRYEAEVRRLAGDDPRIVVRPPVSRDELPRLFSDHDALAVPSLWLETGPLVVLEAQAAGLFVIGSRLGGIAELVDDSSGLLLPPGDVAAWAKAIGELAAQRSLPTVRSVHPRSMSDIAADMGTIYQDLMS